MLSSLRSLLEKGANVCGELYRRSHLLVQRVFINRVAVSLFFGSFVERFEIEDREPCPRSSNHPIGY
jgi:hypothetical protein